MGSSSQFVTDACCSQSASFQECLSSPATTEPLFDRPAAPKPYPQPPIVKPLSSLLTTYWFRKRSLSLHGAESTPFGEGRVASKNPVSRSRRIGIVLPLPWRRISTPSPPPSPSLFFLKNPRPTDTYTLPPHAAFPF